MGILDGDYPKKEYKGIFKDMDKNNKVDASVSNSKANKILRK